MALFIIRIQDKPDGGVTRTVMGGSYGDRQEAITAVEKLLTEYPQHGPNDEQGYWWANATDGQRYRFVIES